MTVKQTRCPFCHSAFYITALQLNAYRGQARCGQCHQIFDATTNMPVTSNPIDPQVEKTDPVTEAVVIQSDSPATSGTPAQLEPRIRAAHRVSYAIPTRPASKGSVDSNATVIKAPVAAQTVAEKPVLDDHPDDSTDERFSDDQGIAETKSAQSMLDSAYKSDPTHEDQLLFSDDSGLFDEDEPVINTNKSDSPFLGDSFNQQFLDDTFEDIDVLKQQELNEVEKLHAGADESWINDLLKDEKKPVVNIEPDLKPIVVTPAPEYKPLAESVVQRTPVDYDEDLLSFLNRTGAVTMPSTSARSNTSPNNTAAPRPASHRILKPTTVKYNPWYFIGWGFMSLLMLALLIGQYIYFNFEHMAMDPKTSGYISRLCSITGCQIPYMNEDELHVKKVKLIANNRLGETTFHAQLSNSAHLSQPFPALRLTFKRDGKIVASQIIQPRQYLPDNLKTLTRLATKTPYPVQFTVQTRRSDIQSFSLEPQYH